MLVTDFHVHTLMSGHAFCTFNECVAAAAEKGLSVVALTDHGPSMQKAPYEGYFLMAPRVPRKFPRLRVLFGCEANIVDLDGSLDLPEKTLAGLDLVLANVHHRTPYQMRGERENTTALIKALQKNRIHIISHLYRPDFPVTIEEVLPVAIERRVLIEINKSIVLTALENQHSAEARTTIAKTAAIVDFLQTRGVGFVINSDAHHTFEIGIDADELARLTHHLHLEPEYIYNEKLSLLESYIPALAEV
jgi:putative hydrolase